MKTLECEDCGRIVDDLPDYVRHDNVKCAPCHGKMNLIANKEPVADDGLIAKLIEVDSLIRCVHLDMGGNDKYHISPRHNDQIGKLIKECLYIAARATNY